MSEKHKLNEKFSPKDFEENLYSKWEEKGYFKPNEDENKEAYCIMIPPPNVTGKLHMGHALNNTIQDVLIRFKRMQGFNTLWVPGTDHSSISTEMKVVQKLKSEGKSKHEIGREKFLEEAWDWTEIYGGTIENQLKKLGCSCDWSRNRFTLDEGLSKAVLEQFVQLYRRDLIYKGKRLVNWCTNCNTSVSDVEVEHHEEQTHLWHIRYKVKDEEKYITVATTRPETMLGDTAVAVHPDDERYVGFVGKTCILPIVNKEIPIIADRFVEKEFGTGAVKITPAHDMNDYQAGIRNNLDIVEVFDDNFKMNDIVPEFKGMDLLEARKEIVKKLENMDALVKTEEYTHNVAKCERCKHTIEPKISDQWFVKMEDLVKPAIKAVKDKDINFVPSKYEKTYFNWMDNIQDWCISRQLWWGHRIPAYYCDECEHINVAKEAPTKCEKCGSKKLHQDEDTLDTWFSSALWPFSTLGWPEQTKDLKMFYPTNVLVTAYEIITFWVARMITSGIDLIGEIPFDTVLIHGIVRDNQGRKMSKTLGNGIDPIDVINEHGTDALRFSLIHGITIGNDIRYMSEKLEQSSNFCNKLWNAAKFVLMNLEDYNYEEVDILKLKTEDKWILSKLNRVTEEINNNIDNFDLGVALEKIYSFIWNEFCDWYIEIVKTRLYNKDDKLREQAQYVLNEVLKNSLKLLHPFMPFITEEIYEKLYNVDGSIMIAEFPEYNEKYNFEKEESEIEVLKQLVTEIRNIRTTMNVHPTKKSQLIFVTKKYRDVIQESENFLLKLGFGKETQIKEDKKGIEKNAISILLKDLELYIPFGDLVDIEEERKRLEVEKEKLESEVSRGEKMLINSGFVNKAPKEKIDEEKEKLKDYKNRLENIKKRLDSM